MLDCAQNELQIIRVARRQRTADVCVWLACGRGVRRELGYLFFSPFQMKIKTESWKFACRLLR